MGVSKKTRENLIYTYFRGEAAGVNFYNTVSFLSGKEQKLVLNSGSLKYFSHMNTLPIISRSKKMAFWIILSVGNSQEEKVAHQIMLTVMFGFKIFRNCSFIS